MADANLDALKQIAFGDLERELAVTRKILERAPDGRFAWRPHEKSMTFGQLATHVADLPQWMKSTLEADELDAAAMPAPEAEPGNCAELVARFDRRVAELRPVVARFDMQQFNGEWTMRDGAQIMARRPRGHVFRVWCLSHLIHHRGQLCLYLRLLNLPVPTVYFNTADDPTWVFE